MKEKQEEYKKFIKNDIATFAKDINILRNLIRYQNVHRNINESVAEHLFYVSCLVLKLREYYTFDLEKALKTALIHDIQERYISDVPHNIKTANPNLAKALKEAEDNITTQIFSDEACEYMKNFNHGTSPEGLAVQLADVLSVVLYASAEIESGNQVFNYISIKAISRYKDIMNKIDAYRNPQYTKEQLINKIDTIVNIY